MLIATDGAGIIDNFPFIKHIVVTSMFSSQSFKIAPQLSGKSTFFGSGRMSIKIEQLVIDATVSATFPSKLLWLKFDGMDKLCRDNCRIS